MLRQGRRRLVGGSGWGRMAPGHRRFNHTTAICSIAWRTGSRLRAPSGRPGAARTFSGSLGLGRSLNCTCRRLQAIADVALL